MRANRYILITVISATLLFFVLWQTAVAGPPMKPGNPGVPGLLAEIAELEDMLDQLQYFAPVPPTGQLTSYATGDDGDLQKGVAWPNPRFKDNLDGTVTDNLTGLMWIKDASRGCFDTMGWQDALDGIADFNANPGPFLCNDYTANYSDWRLPNLNELKSLVHYGCDMPSISNTAGTACWDGDPFFGVRADHYWSGTTCTWDPRAAWTLNFTHGQGIPYDKTYTDRASVWPVRGGN